MNTRTAFLGTSAFTFRQALRTLAARPAFTIVTLLTLTLGIGAGTAVFALSNWLIFRPVPGIARPKDLVTIRLEFADRAGGFYTMSMPEYRAVAATPGIRALAAAADVSFHVATSNEAPVRVSGGVVTSNYFQVLEQRMTAGRAFGAAEDDPGNASVAVISDGFWRQVLARDPNVLGRQITINGQPFRVVGVAAQGFHGPDRSGHADLWVPVASFRSSMPSYPATLLTGNVGIFFSLIGRPAPGVAAGTINEQLKVTQANLSAAQPKFGKYKRSFFAAHDGLMVPAWQRDGLRQMFALLLGIAALLMILTSANVANLLFAHAHERAAELATRQALGATRGHVVRQLVLEGLILSLGGGSLALLLSAALGRWIDGMVIAKNLPALSAVGIDWRVFVFAVGISILTCVAASLAPAFIGSRVDLVASLKVTGRGSLRANRTVRRALTFVQVSVAVMLLAVGSLLVRSVLARYRVPLGYDADQVLAFSVDASVQGYSKERTVTYFRDTLAALRQVPGVSNAGLAYIEPFRLIGMGDLGLTPVGRPDAAETMGDANMVSEGFFPTLGVRFVNGRDFRPEEVFHSDASGNGVLIVNETMARKLFGTSDASGRQATATFPDTRVLTIVGVVSDLQTRDAGGAPIKATAYEPFGQSFLSGWGALHLRVTEPAAAVAPRVREVMRRLDGQLPIYDVELVSESLDRFLAEPLLLARTVETFAVLATLIAALGLYGVLSRGVEERRKEFGIRVALGARPLSVAGSITREAIAMSLAGGIAGAGGAVWLAHVIEARLFGVRAADPLSLGAAMALAVVVGLAASVAPAIRASRVDVVHELR